MDEIFVIGLPLAIIKKLEARAKGTGIRFSSIALGKGKKGKPKLLPHPSQAIYNLQEYFDRVVSHEGEPSIIVLPYAQIPYDVYDELAVIEEMGGNCEYIEEGKDGWPELEKGQLDSQFLTDLARRLEDELFPKSIRLPSESFKNAVECCGRIIIPEGSISECDEVAEYRRTFFHAACDAFVEIAQSNGQVGPIDLYFKTLGIDHAQSGGISATLELYKDGDCVIKKTTNVHLKQGDKTTREAAARLYYTTFEFEQRYFLAVLYAGPHPDTDVIVRVDIDEFDFGSD